MFLLKYLLLSNLLVIGMCHKNVWEKYLSRNDEHHGRIVGGFKTTIEENPWQVSLMIEGDHFCGGTIISPKWIVTAVHCVRATLMMNNRPAKITVRVGSSLVGEGGKTVNVDKYINYPQEFHSPPNIDVSLLKLAHPLEFSKGIGAIPLAKSEIPTGTDCLVTGWGNTEQDIETKYSANRLNAVNVPIIDHKKCKKAYENLNDFMICAGYNDGGKDACQGDSGGPLICNGELAGVVSFGTGCAAPGFPGVYAKISAVRSWIKKETGI